MFGVTSLLQTKSGLLQINADGFVDDCWSGVGFIENVELSSMLAPVRTILTEEGGSVVVGPYTRVLVSGNERYMYKSSRDLREGDRICITNPSGKYRPATAFKRKSWLLGLCLSGSADSSYFRARLSKKAMERSHHINKAVKGTPIKVHHDRLHAPRKEFEDWLACTAGCSLTHNGRFDEVPMSVLISPDSDRRAFCNGLILNCGELDSANTHHIPLNSLNLINDVALIFRNSGLAVHATKDQLLVNAWAAGLLFDTHTYLPNEAEMSGKTVPADEVDQFIDWCSNLKSPSKVLKIVRDTAKRTGEVHPHIMKASKCPNYEGIYDYETIISVRSHPEGELLYTREPTNVAADGYILDASDGLS